MENEQELIKLKVFLFQVFISPLFCLFVRLLLFYFIIIFFLDDLVLEPGHRAVGIGRG